MRRREFIALLGGAVAGNPLPVRAQQPEPVRRIVVLMGAAETTSTRGWLASFLHRLDQLGWRDRRNLFTQVQWWNDRPEQMRVWAAELIAGSPDVAVTFTNLALEVMKPIAGSVPIVFIGVGDPVGSGFISSFAHPGGNITGFASHDPSMGSKWLEVLKETAPNISRVLVLMEPETTVLKAMLRSIEEVAPRLSVETTVGGVHDEFVAVGGLVSYGLDWDDQFRHAAEYVDQILRGTKPADLPVQAPTKYQLVLNLQTAKTLGLSIPQTILARADEVIE
jgi:putative ABC transport system substrate-binding protein